VLVATTGGVVAAALARFRLFFGGLALFSLFLFFFLVFLFFHEEAGDILGFIASLVLVPSLRSLNDIFLLACEALGVCHGSTGGVAGGGGRLFTGIDMRCVKLGGVGGGGKSHGVNGIINFKRGFLIVVVVVADAELLFVFVFVCVRAFRCRSNSCFETLVVRLLLLLLSLLSLVLLLINALFAMLLLFLVRVLRFTVALVFFRFAFCGFVGLCMTFLLWFCCPRVVTGREAGTGGAIVRTPERMIVRTGGAGGSCRRRGMNALGGGGDGGGEGTRDEDAGGEWGCVCVCVCGLVAVVVVAVFFVVVVMVVVLVGGVVVVVLFLVLLLVLICIRKRALDLFLVCCLCICVGVVCRGIGAHMVDIETEEEAETCTSKSGESVCGDDTERLGEEGGEGAGDGGGDESESLSCCMLPLRSFV